MMIMRKQTWGRDTMKARCSPVQFMLATENELKLYVTESSN
uniref:Uncharacterized protein n=1 Tax=Octopus bimaculoides TaxID=37653 RepID=A0A0L8GPJ3_OCTBM